MSNTELAKDIINEVLSSSEFQPKKKADLSMFDKYREFIQKILDKIEEILSKLIGKLLSKINLFGLGEKFISLSNTAKMIIYIIAIALIVLLAYFLVRLVIRVIKNTSKYKKKKDSLADELEEFTKSPDEPLRLALEYKEKKEYRLSFRYFFLSLLINFNQNELITIQKFKTNRHYLRELYVNSYDLGEKSASFFEAFNLIWYGKRDINEESLEEWKKIYDELIVLKKEEGEVIANQN